LALLRARADQIARAELEKTLSHLGEGLSEKQRRSIEAMAIAIINKLLHQPTAKLREASLEEGISRLAGAAAELFGLEETPSPSPPRPCRQGPAGTAALKTLRIATRQSPLALWQARHVAQLLTEHHPGLRVSLVEMTTEGDRFLQSRLSERGGKGLFVKEIESAVLEGKADLAVHSLKDMTSALPKQLCIAAVPPRE